MCNVVIFLSEVFAIPLVMFITHLHLLYLVSENELDDLAAEAEVPIEELLKQYKQAQR